MTLALDIQTRAIYATYCLFKVYTCTKRYENLTKDVEVIHQKQNSQFVTLDIQTFVLYSTRHFMVDNCSKYHDKRHHETILLP